MRKYGYLVVEGPHDVEFAYRLLSPFGLNRVRYKTPHKDKPKEEILDEKFHCLIPNYPGEEGDIQVRPPIPLFLQNQTHSIAIHSAIGDSRLVELIEETNWKFKITSMVGIGILLDTDKAVPAQKRYADVKTKLADVFSQQLFILPDDAGTIKKGQPNLGAFVLPDNQTAGTLEDLLLESAERVYPELLKMARNYVSEAKENAHLKSSELSELRNAGTNKAVIGAMANIFKPGKSVQVSIQDNDWLRGKALAEVKRIQAVQTFLKTLFDLT